MEAYRYKLAVEWDNHIINVLEIFINYLNCQTFKLRENNQIIQGEIPITLGKFKSMDSVGPDSPTKESQYNQIEDFTKRSMRNFRKFLSLQSEGNLKLPL